MKQTRAIALAILTGITVISATGCAVMRGQTDAATYVDDRTITTAVKAKLIEDKTTGGLSINVDTLNGTVALSGFAKSQAEKDRAGQIAATTKGVREVRNNLVVRP
jgi:hyperosmotically inducible protein